MSVGAVRSPTRPLASTNIAMAYPGELLIDPSTGNLLYINDSMGQVTHNKPGTLTVNYGDSALVSNADLSGNVTVDIPNAEISGLTANRVLISSASGGLITSDITTTLLGYLANVTSDIQTQLNSKLATTGTAAAATKLATAHTIKIGSSTAKGFDGTADIAFTLTEIGAAAASHNHEGVYLPIGGTAAAATVLATARTITVGSTGKQFDGSADISFTLTEIGAAAASHNHNGVYLPIGGTATAASKLATAQNITIGSATKAFDGSAAISFTLAEIGAAAASHTHSNYLPTTGGTVSGNLSVTGTLSAGTLSGVRKDFSGTLSTSWSGSAAPYTQTVTISGILSTDRPILDFTCSGTYATDQSREEGWLNIYRATTAANKITFYAHEKPTVSIPFYAQVTR